MSFRCHRLDPDPVRIDSVVVALFAVEPAFVVSVQIVSVVAATVCSVAAVAVSVAAALACDVVAALACADAAVAVSAAVAAVPALHTWMYDLYAYDAAARFAAASCLGCR